MLKYAFLFAIAISGVAWMLTPSPTEEAQVAAVSVDQAAPQSSTNDNIDDSEDDDSYWDEEADSSESEQFATDAEEFDDSYADDDDAEDSTDSGEKRIVTVSRTPSYGEPGSDSNPIDVSPAGGRPLQ
jgi:hypothetical protein